MAPAGTNQAERKSVTLFSALRTLLTVVAVSYFAFWACCASDACMTGADCDTGYCFGNGNGNAQGTCCATACTGACESCATGTCLPTRVAAACLSDGTVCNGVCDGVHADCSYPDSTVQCTPPSCDSAANTATLASFCNGTGACPAAQTQTCALAACAGTQCNACTNTSDCPASQHCTAGVCLANLAIAAACNTNTDCASGFCVDGVCCGSACTAQCEACNVTGNEGACVPVSGPPHGSRQPCAGGGSACEGQCNGTATESCTYPGAETQCPINSTTCNASQLAGASCACKTGVRDVCDGTGSCYAPPAIRCECPDAGVPMDAGMIKEAGTDAAVGPEAGMDASPAPPADTGTGPSGGVVEGGGCDCRAAGDEPSGQAWLAGIVAGAFLASRRSRRRVRIGDGRLAARSNA